MIHVHQIGDIRITGLTEYIGPTHDPEVLYPDWDPEFLNRHDSWLNNDFWFKNLGRLVIGIQIWIVHAGDRVILIDTGVGNHKPRGPERMHLLNTLAPQWLAAAGASVDQVTDVVMTHLHSDHVGWNTVPDGQGGWQPAFPNARYVMPEVDIAHFRALFEAAPQDDPSFGDSIAPILDAGLVDFVKDGDLIAGYLRAQSAPGHTPGQTIYWIDDRAVFCADLFHHPLQIVEPQLNTAYCVLPDEARTSRRAFLERAAQTGALIMPCHFGGSHCGTISRDGEQFSYVPADPAIAQRF